MGSRVTIISKMAPGKKRTNTAKPSTSKETASKSESTKENIRPPKRVASKNVKPSAMIDDDSSSGDDFEPVPPKIVKKPLKVESPKEKKSQKKPKEPKKKISPLPLVDNNAN